VGENLVSRVLCYIGEIVQEKSVLLRHKGNREWFKVEFTSKAQWRSFFMRWRTNTTKLVHFAPDSKRFYFDA
jgi:hypothetical protein